MWPPLPPPTHTSFLGISGTHNFFRGSGGLNSSPHLTKTSCQPCLLLILFMSQDRVPLCNLAWSGTPYVDQAGHELIDILLPLPWIKGVYHQDQILAIFLKTCPNHQANNLEALAPLSHLLNSPRLLQGFLVHILENLGPLPVLPQASGLHIEIRPFSPFLQPSPLMRVWTRSYVSSLCPQPVVTAPWDTDTQSPLFRWLQQFTKSDILLAAQEPMGDLLSSSLNNILALLPCVRDLGECCRDQKKQQM